MTDQIISIQKIKSMARVAVEGSKAIADCPFPPGTSAYDHWVTEFHRLQMEERAVIES